VSLHELGALGTTMSVEWLVGPGLFMYLPPLFEGLLEYGGLVEGMRRIITGFDSTASILPGGLLYWLMTLVFFTFQNKTKSAAVRQALCTGSATYRATGRPNANTRLTLVDTFLQYRSMHYKDACVFLFYYALYRAANMGLSGALPMATILFACICWLIVPTLFAPYPSWANLCEDVTTFYHFMMRCPADRSRAELHQSRMWLNVCASGLKPAQDVPKKGAKGQPGNLFEVLLAEALEKDERLTHRFFDDLLQLMSSAFSSAMLLAVLPSAAVEACEFCLLTWICHAFLVLAFGYFLDLLWIAVLFLLFYNFISMSTSMSTALFAVMLCLQVLDTVAKLLLFTTRRWRKLPGRGCRVTSSNIYKGMRVMPGRDWMYDMKKDDAKQNSAPGCSMIGTVIECDSCKDLAYCEVRWVNGAEGRYRISGMICSSNDPCDLRRYPDWYSVVVEAVVLLFGHYHVNLIVAFIVLVAHSATSALLVLLDSSYCGCLHARMMRMPTRTQMEALAVKEGAPEKGSSGAPHIAMTELADEIVVEDLKREPWARRDLRPSGSPQPSPPILADPAYRGAEWKELCRVRLRRVSLRDSAKELRKEFGIVAMAIESKDGLECGLCTPLEKDGFLLFGWEQGVENWAGLKEFLGLDEETDPKEHVERVWLPVYKFEVPEAFTGQPWHKFVVSKLSAASGILPEPASEEGDGIFALTGAMARLFRQQVFEKGKRTLFKSKLLCNSKSAGEWAPPELCGAVFRQTTQWFPGDDVIFQKGDQMILPQGSVQSFATLRARAFFGHSCLGAGSKLVYCISMPQDCPAARRVRSAEAPAGPTRTSSRATSSCASGLPQHSAFEYAKLFVMNAMTKDECLELACTSKASYRASRLPHLWPHAAPHGLVTVGVEASPEDGQCSLLFGFTDEAPNERGLSLFCGFKGGDASRQLEHHVETRWLPVFNFAVPEAWVGRTVKRVLQGEGLSILGISRSAEAEGFSRQLWFPGLRERFDRDDEVILSLQSACSFAAKYHPHEASVGHASVPSEDGRLPTGRLRKYPWQPGYVARLGRGVSHEALHQAHLGFLWNWEDQPKEEEEDEQGTAVSEAIERDISKRSLDELMSI